MPPRRIGTFIVGGMGNATTDSDRCVTFVVAECNQRRSAVANGGGALVVQERSFIELRLFRGSLF